MRLILAVFMAAVSALMGAPVAAQTYAYIPNQTDNTVSVIDTASNAVVATVPLPGASFVEAVAINAAGTKAYFGSRNGTVSVLDTATLTASPAVSMGGATPQVFTLAINPAGTRLYASDFDANVITVIDTTVDPVAVIDTITGLNNPYAIAFHPSGARFYVANRFGENVAVIDAATHAVGFIPTPGRWPINIVLDASGDTAYINHDGGTHGATIITGLNGTPSAGAPLATGNNPRGIAISPDGGRVYVANATDFTVSVIDTASGTIANTVPTFFPWGISVHPADQRVYVTNYLANTVSVFDAGMNPITAIPVGNTPVPLGMFIGTVPGPEADLALAVTAAHASRRVGQSTSFGVGIHNDGPEASGATTLGLSLDAATSGMIVSAPAGWACDPPAQGANDTSVLCNGSDVVANASVFFNVSLPLTDAMGGLPLTLSALVDGSTGDPVPGDNSDSASVQVTAEANLRLSFSGPVAQVRSGATVPIYARLDNSGANAARNATVTLQVAAPPPSVSVVAPAGWSCFGGDAARSPASAVPTPVVGAVFQCSYGETFLPRGSSVFRLNVVAPASAAGGFVGINGLAGSQTSDPQPGNNSASFKLYVRNGGTVTPVSDPIH